VTTIIVLFLHERPLLLRVSLFVYSAAFFSFVTKKSVQKKSDETNFFHFYLLSRSITSNNMMISHHYSKSKIFSKTFGVFLQIKIATSDEK
jgi:hypothetical protein